MNDGILIESPLVLDFNNRDCRTVFEPLEKSTGWRHEDVITAALYVGGLFLLHGVNWKHLLKLDPQAVAIRGFSRHIHCMAESFLLYGEPHHHLERIVTHYAPTFDPEKGAYVLDKVILHVLPPFVHLTGGDDGGGGEFLHIADELQLSIRSKLAA